jgi:uncharacterized protein GlcG (DUF336 family)
MSRLTLSKANQIIQNVIKTARSLKLAPLTVVVLDEAGHLKAMQREDGATVLRQQIATAKAWSAVNMGISSRALAAVAEQRPDFMNALIGIAEGKVMPVAGGVLIRDADNAIIGAVGVSGDVSDQDEFCAITGIETADLRAEV